MHKVAVLNTRLGRYVVDFLSADAGRIEPIAVADEKALADQVAKVADGIRARAARRTKQGDPSPLVGPRVSGAT